jgi:hypothetical protein
MAILRKDQFKKEHAGGEDDWVPCMTAAPHRPRRIHLPGDQRREKHTLSSPYSMTRHNRDL